MSHNEGRPCSFSFTVLQKMQMLSHVTFYCQVTWLITPQGALGAIIDWEMLLFEISTQSTPAPNHQNIISATLVSPERISALFSSEHQCGEWDGDDGGWKRKTLHLHKCWVLCLQTSTPSWQYYGIGTAARPMGVLVILIVNPQFAWNHFNSFGI